MRPLRSPWIGLVLALWAQAASASENAIKVQGGPWRLDGRAYQSARLSAHPHLLVVLHGDAPGINPSYQYVFAQRAAAALNDVIAVGLLRPGYADGMGGKSEGSRGWAIADNYTAGDIASVAAALKALKTRYHAADLTLAGHSGGAALTADIIALYPQPRGARVNRVLPVRCARLSPQHDEAAVQSAMAMARRCRVAAGSRGADSQRHRCAHGCGRQRPHRAAASYLRLCCRAEAQGRERLHCRAERRGPRGVS
jgi:pimeloyl-ACP methyl ester carboxylesterase